MARRFLRRFSRRVVVGGSLALAAVVCASTAWAACSASRAGEDPAAFVVTGEPVAGTEGIAGAPVLGPGRYADRAPAAATAKHYIVRRTIDRSTVFVGVSARPKAPSRDDRLALHLWTVAGTPCGTTSTQDFDQDGLNSLVTLAVSSRAPEHADREACRNATELHLVVEPRYGNSTLADIPAELVVIEQPEPTARAGMPPAATEAADWGTPMAIADRSPVHGAASFAGARLLRAGSYRSTIAPGAVRLFRVQLRSGQRLRIELSVNRPRGRLANQLEADQRLELRLIAPTRAEAGVAYDELPGDAYAPVRRDRPTRLVQLSYDVRYRNRESPRPPISTGATLAGDYYVLVTLAQDPDEDDTYSLPYHLDVAVDDVTDAVTPTYREGAEVAGPVGKAPGSPLPPLPAEQPLTLAIVLLVAGLVLLAFGGGCLLVARRATSALSRG